ncbi:hypothetical protein [Mycobacteroides chelonae]|uniref:hypothetical protein n=1 Tax=Mycobacteroides chelonae TaxID=1774 RepID=UPI001041D988|nr:hypothetical protein [Mycobacteroides chelonae]
MSMFASLASQFQGFCRDLHDETAIILADSLSPGNDPQIPIVLNSLVRERKLDRGNAGPGNIGNDFAIFEIQLWPQLKNRYPSQAPSWNEVLETLNTLRNGVAHSDQSKIDEVKRSTPLTLRTWKSWRGKLNSAATGLDAVVGAYLQNLVGTTW